MIHAPGELREVHRRLSGGVAAADDVHVLAARERRLARAGAVVHAGAEKALLVGQREAPVVDAGRADRGARDDLGAVVQHADALAGGKLGAHALAREQDLGAELARLFAGALGELGTADPLRKAEIVLELRAARRLPADRGALDHDGLQAVGCAVHRGAEARWPRAVDREVVLRARGVREPAELLGHLAQGRTLHARAVRELADRKTRIPGAVALDPFEGNVAAVQEIAQPVTFDRSQSAVDPDQRLLRHPRLLRRQHQRQRHRSRQCLYPEDLAAHGERAEDAGDDHAGEKKDLHAVCGKEPP